MVSDSHVAVNNIKPLRVAMETQEWVHLHFRGSKKHVDGRINFASTVIFLFTLDISG